MQLGVGCVTLTFDAQSDHLSFAKKRKDK